MNILHIDSSPRGEASHSRKMTAELVATLQETHSNATVTYRDLGHQPPPFVTEDWQNGAYTPEEQRTPAQTAALKYSDQAIDELLAADIVVIGAPMYNLTVSADLKAWLDQIIRINKTFTADYKGLATGKKVFVVTSRGGGGYEAGEAMEHLNFQDPYLKTAFSFTGITDVKFISVNNTAKGDEAVRESTENARAMIHTAALSSVAY
ncbi:MAG: NAD(P)H-dependent oxidoreductase [Acidobacteriota bacterium]|nr:NAD(P)H-dependent oxidoreductase [Acidobacteriota bacterium]